MTLTLQQIADATGARLVGDAAIVIDGLGSLENAQPGQLSHLSSAGYRKHLTSTRASAIILQEADLALWSGNALVDANPYLCFALASQLFAVPQALEAGIDPSARIDPSAVLGSGVRVGCGVVIGPRVHIGANARIHPHCLIGADCDIADDVVLHGNCTLYSNVGIGQRTVVHSGTVLGADGFGFTPDEQGHLRAIAQLGGLRIGEGVSIGAGTTIDRGAIDNTVIDDGVKIDNQVQIGHNCHIGAHSVICGCVGIVGSTTIGRHCVLAGGVGIGGDGPITLCDQVVVSGMTHVSSSISRPGVYSGGVLHNVGARWKRNALRFQQLDSMAKRLARLERTLKK